MIAGAKRVQSVTHAVHIIEKFADGRSPSGGAGKGVMRSYVMTSPTVLEDQRRAVVAGAVVGAEYGGARRGRRQGNTLHVFIASVLVDAALVLKLRGQVPAIGKGVFDSPTRLNRIRRVIVRIDHGRRKTALHIGIRTHDGIVDSLERLGPSALAQIVVVKAESRADHSVTIPGRVSNA